MPQAAYWKGHLKLSLVTAKVSLTPAKTQSAKIRFHILNRETGNRVESRYIDRETRKAVSSKNQVKGFPKDDSDSEFVILEDKELDAVTLESTKTINIESFVPAGSIPWIWYDRPHFLKPDDKVSTEAYGVIRQAMKTKKVVGIARLVLYGREHAVLLEPSGKGIVVWTLRYGETVREPVAEAGKAGKSDKEAIAALDKLIDGKTTKWQARMVRDPLQKKIQDLLDKSMKAAKSDGKKEAPATKTKKTGNVIDITDALRKSLAAESSK